MYPICKAFIFQAHTMKMIASSGNSMRPNRLRTHSMQVKSKKEPKPIIPTVGPRCVRLNRSRIIPYICNYQRRLSFVTAVEYEDQCVE